MEVSLLWLHLNLCRCRSIHKLVTMYCLFTEQSVQPSRLYIVAGRARLDVDIKPSFEKLRWATWGDVWPGPQHHHQTAATLRTHKSTQHPGFELIAPTLSKDQPEIERSGGGGWAHNPAKIGAHSTRLTLFTLRVKPQSWERFSVLECSSHFQLHLCVRAPHVLKHSRNTKKKTTATGFT